MTPNPDDEDAFSWEGDEHPTRAPLHRPSAEKPDAVPTAAVDDVQAHVPAEDAAAAVDGSADADEQVAAAPMGNVALVASGLLGGIYLLYAIGWVIGGLRVSRVADALVAVGGNAPVTWSSGNVVGVWLAALAPLLWFATVWVVTRRSRSWVRWTWLIAGALLLVPWPLTMLGVQL